MGSDTLLKVCCLDAFEAFKGIDEDRRNRETTSDAASDRNRRLNAGSSGPAGAPPEGIYDHVSQPVLVVDAT